MYGLQAAVRELWALVTLWQLVAIQPEVHEIIDLAYVSVSSVYCTALLTDNNIYLN